MKKILTIVVLIVSLFFVSQVTSIHADDDPILMLPGASIRTTGTQGLKYQAAFEPALLTQERGFFMVFGEASLAELQVVVDDMTMSLNGKDVYKTNPLNYDQVSPFISVVLTGIPVSGYTQQISVFAYAYDGVDYTYVPAGVSRSVAEVALNAANQGAAVQVSTVLNEINAAYLKTSNDDFDEFGNFNISLPLYEYNREALREEFITDWNAFNGTTWTELVASDLFASASIGVTGPTDLSGSNIYNFFNDPVMGDKWIWLLTFIENNDGTVHPSRQVVAIKGDGTNGTYALYYSDQLSYSIANFFNKAHEVGGYTSIDFTSTAGLAKYNNIPTYNNRVYVEYSSYTYVKIGDSITIPDVSAKVGYTTNGYLDGSTPISSGPGYVVTTVKKLIPQYDTVSYDINYFDDATALTSLDSTYTVEAAVTLATYEKDGYTFDGWYDNPEFTGSVIIDIPEGSTGNKIYYAKTTEAVQSSITYNANGGDFYQYSTRAEMVSDFIVDFNTQSGLTVTSPTFYGDTYHGSLNYVINFFDSAAFSSKWSWMKTYILDTGNSTGYTSQSNLTNDTASTWRSNVWAFINSDYRTAWPASIDFSSSANADGFWSSIQESPILVYTHTQEHVLETPFRLGFTFDGWYEESDFSGSVITEIADTETGAKVYYAKWTAE